MKNYLDIAKEMDLFHQEAHSPGVLFWHPNGFVLWEKLKSFIRLYHKKYGYKEVKSPNLVGLELFKLSGHLEKFNKNMFLSEEYAIRPMSCPNHISIYQNKNCSYKDLPYKLFEFGEVCRNEASGALQSLFRMRAFCQDDSHMFVQENQIQQEVFNYLSMVEEIYDSLNLKKRKIILSLRPDERFGDDSLWDKAENYLREACKMKGFDFLEVEKGGAFYGPKLEINIEDSLGRDWQLGVIQLDFVLPERFDLRYRNQENQFSRPVILHHAVFGSMERFLGILLEEYAYSGKFPYIFHPEPIAVLPVSEKFLEYSEEVVELLEKNGFEVLRSFEGSLSSRIAKNKKKHIPFLLVLGEQEVNSRLVNINFKGEKISVKIEEVVEKIKSLKDQV